MKKYLLVISMVILMLLPLAMNAQSDGFFRNEKSSGDRTTEITLGGGGTGGDGFTFGSAPQQENPSAPVDGGLLIMVTAGAGYALLKRKETAK